MSEMELDEFDEVLAKALRHVDAPDRFADRVMLRAGAKKPAKVLMFPTVKGWVGGAIAAALVLGVFGGEKVHERREQAKAELVERQFETAIRVTDRALDQTQVQLQRAGFKLGE